MNAVEMTPEMNELAELFATFAAHVVPHFVVHPENVLAQDLLLVVALLAHVTRVFSLVVVNRVDVDLHFFRADELLAADFARVSGDEEKGWRS